MFSKFNFALVTMLVSNPPVFKNLPSFETVGLDAGAVPLPMSYIARSMKASLRFAYL